MIINIFILFRIFIFLLAIINQFTDCVFYKAGVVEYYYNVKSKLKPRQILEQNINKYINLVESFNKTWPALHNGILVFPESGLISQSNDKLISVAVPEPNINQNNFSGFEIIYPLSNAANKYHKWLVVNLVEKDGPKIYNTDVVFRSNGTIAAKYRKYNLFNELVNRPSKAEVVSFTTDFNVTFGIFTCFDILYAHPALDLVERGIKHIIFPTAWYSELPFLSAIQYQKGWSWSNEVSLLAAGLSYSKLGSTGSGIYQGRKGNDVYYQTSNSSENHLLMMAFASDDEDYFKSAHLKFPAEKVVEEIQSKEPIGLKLLHEPLNSYTTALIKPEGCAIPTDDLEPGKILNCTKNVVQNLTNHDFHCDFHVIYVFNVYICKELNCNDAESHRQKSSAEDDFSLSLHRLAAFNGVRSFYVATGGVQTCAVVPCTDEKLSSCGFAPKTQDLYCFKYDNHRACVLKRYIKYVSIGGQFNENNTFVTPNILLRNNDNTSGFGKITNEFQMSNNNGYYSLVYDVSPDDVVGTAGIWSRVFERDGHHVTGSSSSFSPAIVIALTLILIYPALRST